MTNHTYGKDDDLPILSADDDLGDLPVFDPSVKKKIFSSKNWGRIWRFFDGWANRAKIHNADSAAAGRS